MIIFSLQTPVSVNQKGRIGAHGYFCSKKYRDWFETSLYQLKELELPSFGDARIGISITTHFQDDRRRDLDNILKGLFDVCTKAGLWNDDSQIDNLHVVRGEVRKWDLYRIQGQLAEIVKGTETKDLKKMIRAKQAIKIDSYGKVEVRVWEIGSED